MRDDLADRIAIRELTARYNNAWIDRDPEAWCDTFTEGGSIEVVDGPTIQGHEALREMFNAMDMALIHLTTDAVIVVDADRATQRCSLMTAAPTAAGEVQLTGIGHYSDSLVRTAQGWRFDRRTVVSKPIAPAG
jgi:uncharacterized protein (TIGR02246 family)